jgi:hypothetical protein
MIGLFLPYHQGRVVQVQPASYQTIQSQTNSALPSVSNVNFVIDEQKLMKLKTFTWSPLGKSPMDDAEFRSLGNGGELSESSSVNSYFLSASLFLLRKQRFIIWAKHFLQRLKKKSYYLNVLSFSLTPPSSLKSSSVSS